MRQPHNPLDEGFAHVTVTMRRGSHHRPTAQMTSSAGNREADLNHAVHPHLSQLRYLGLKAERRASRGHEGGRFGSLLAIARVA
jgi:hypothetical protein